MATPVSLLVYADSPDLKNLIKTLKSVLTQSKLPSRIILVDAFKENRSKKISRISDRVEYLHRKNQDLNNAIHSQIRVCGSKYFVWIRQGDICSANMISSLLETATSDKNQIVAATPSNQTVNLNDHSLVELMLKAEKFPELAFVDGVFGYTCVSILFPTASLLGFYESYSTEVIPDYNISSLAYLVSDIRHPHKFKITTASSFYKLPRELNGSDYEQLDKVFAGSVRNLKAGHFIEYFSSDEKALHSSIIMMKQGLRRISAVIASSILKTSEAGMAKGLLTQFIGTDLPTTRNVMTKKEKKRILFSSAHWLTGGMERVMSVLFDELKEYFDLYLITPFTAEESRIEIPSYINHIRIGQERFTHNFDTMILAIALTFEVDLVIGFINLFDKQLDFYEIAKDFKLKTIASNHEYFFYPYTSKHHYKVAEPRIEAFRYCDAIVWPNTVSTQLCNLYVDNSVTIANPNTFKQLGNLENNKKKNIIIGVGRFNDPVKRVDRMLECLNLVIREIPDARLLLVGKYAMDSVVNLETLETLRSVLERLSIPEQNLSFIGEVADVANYYAQAKVMLVTSLSEGFSMAINEAASYGIPSVSNYMPGVEDLVENGVNGFITPQGDISAMAEKTALLLKDNKTFNRLRNKSIIKVKEFDAKTVGRQWRQLIYDLINNAEAHKPKSQKLGLQTSDNNIASILANELNLVVRSFLMNDVSQPVKRPSLNKMIKNIYNEHGAIKTPIVVFGKVASKARRLTKP